jgi:hypothetical protein
MWQRIAERPRNSLAKSTAIRRAVHRPWQRRHDPGWRRAVLICPGGGVPDQNVRIPLEKSLSVSRPSRNKPRRRHVTILTRCTAVARGDLVLDHRRKKKGRRVSARLKFRGVSLGSGRGRVLFCVQYICIYPHLQQVIAVAECATTPSPTTQSCSISCEESCGNRGQLTHRGREAVIFMPPMQCCGDILSQDDMGECNHELC